MEDPSPDSVLVLGDPAKIRECFVILKKIVIDQRRFGNKPSTPEMQNKEEMSQLRAILKEKEKELSVSSSKREIMIKFFTKY